MLFCIQLLVFFTSCKKELPIDAAVIAQQLVVEGYIEQGRYPRVYLTKTSPYFQTIDSAAMWKLLGSVGKVTVATESDTEVLTLRSNFKQFPPFYFEGTEIKGKVGEVYHLKVELHGKVYTAKTTITPPVPLSHLEVKTNPIDASKKYFLIRFLDPPFQKNYYKIYLKRIGIDQDFMPSYLSTFTDFQNDGQENRFEVLKGYSPLVDKEINRYFKKGDSVLLKFCTINEQQFDYWKKIESLLTISSNPFGLSTADAPSMIDGGALGIWSGQGANYYNIKVK
jgi:hypothetical protein